MDDNESITNQELIDGIAEQFDGGLCLLFLGASNLWKTSLPEELHGVAMHEVYKVIEKHSDILWTTISQGDGSTLKDFAAFVETLSKKSN